MSYTWSRVKTCETEGSRSTLLKCSSASSSTRETYFDTECVYNEQRITTEFDSCVIEYQEGATDRNPSFENYRYGVCQSSSSSSSSSDDDEVSLSQSEYDGAISGSAIAGLVVGVVGTAIILVLCCSCRPGKGKKNGSKSSSSSDGGNAEK